MTLTMDVSTVSAINEGYRQLQTAFKEVYKPQITSLLARPRTTCNLERRQVDTRKLYTKLQKDIVSTSKMLDTELRKRSRNARSDLKGEPAVKRLLEATQAVANLVNEDVEGYCELMEEALDDTSDDETLVAFEEARELHGVPGRSVQPGGRAQEPFDRRRSSRGPRRRVRFLPDGTTPVMSPARRWSRQSQSSVLSPSPPPTCAARHLPHSPPSARHSQHRANQSQVRTPPHLGDARGGLMLEQPGPLEHGPILAQNDYAAPAESLGTSNHGPIHQLSGQTLYRSHLPPQYHSYDTYAGRSHGVTGTASTHGSHTSEQQALPTSRHSHIHDAQNLPAHSRYVQHTSSHIEMGQPQGSGYGCFVASGLVQSSGDIPCTPRKPSRFPSLQGLRGQQASTDYASTYQLNAQARHSGDDYGPVSHRQKQTSHDEQHPINHDRQYQPTPQRASSRELYHRNMRRDQAELDEISMLWATHLSESEIMNDTSAWQAEANEQGRYVRSGREHHSTRRGNW